MGTQVKSKIRRSCLAFVLKVFIAAPFILLTHTLSAQFIHVNVRAFSEGFYRDATNNMIAVANPVNFPLLCDTVVFALIDPMTNLPVYCSKIVLNTDGYGSDSVSTNLSGQMLIPYVRFRNTLGIYSRNEVMINLVSNDFDLTDTGFASMNCNRDYDVAKAFSGDMNGDGYIDPNDFVPYDIDNANGATGYLVTDLNGDGFVDASDFPIFDINNLLSPFDPYWFTCTLASIGEVYHGQFQLDISPDPAVESVRVSTIFIDSPFEIKIYNTVGAIVYSKKYENASEFTIDVSGLKPGVYYLTCSGNSRVRRFVKL